MGVGLLVTLDEEAAHDRSGNTHSCQQQGEDRAGDAVGHSAQGNGRDDRANIGLEEVGAHAGHVAHVIAHVVGDGSGVTGVILGDTGFHLTHQVSAHVGSLGVDTAAHTGKQSDGRSTQREAGQHTGILGDEIDNAAAQQTQTDHAHTHDGTAGEGDGEGLIHAVILGGGSGSHVGLGSHVHAAVAGEGGEQGTHKEGHSSHPVDTEAHHNKQHSHEHHKDLILRHQKGLSALVDECGDFLHSVSSCVLFTDFLGQVQREQQRHHAQNRGKQSKLFHGFCSFLFPFLFPMFSIL